jgi:hypothetical protein
MPQGIEEALERRMRAWMAQLKHGMIDFELFIRKN